MGATRHVKVRGPWALRLPQRQARAAARLRAQEDLEVLELSPHLWLRGPSLSEPLLQMLRQLPGAEVFLRRGEDRLVPLGARLATAAEPRGTWLPAARVFQAHPLPAALAGSRPPGALLRVARGGEERRPTLLRTDRDGWFHFAETASSVRLRALTFALDDQGQALIRGDPLPPLPGVRYVECGGIAIPAGHRWDPPVPPSVVRVLLQLPRGALGLMEVEGVHEVVPVEALVAASRSAVRLSRQGVDHAG